MDESVSAAPIATADPMAYNVEAIAQLEHQELHNRSSGEKGQRLFRLHHGQHALSRVSRRVVRGLVYG